MNTLNIQSVDLISSQRSAPKNGAPSSGEYNDTMREVLGDLVSISDTINEAILPILNVLPEEAKDGLSGTTMSANPDDTGSLFYNLAQKQPYTVAEVLQNLFGMNTDLRTKIADLGGSVAKLQTLMSTTGQSDILASVQSFSDQIKNLMSVITTMKQSLASYESRLQRTRSVRLEVPAVEGYGVIGMDVNWDITFPSNDYTVTLSLEDPNGDLQISGWSKLSAGRGIHVTIHNNNSAQVENGIIHMIGQSNGEAA